MATATYQARGKLFVNAHLVESGDSFQVPDTYVVPKRPDNNHPDPVKVTHTALAVRTA
jgi:hypothetical protein